ncbi:hypothetical protein V5799_031588 [Amblyomma americanum]|uniref:Uncharacterized protein n=1 Tax=Amblyomma americanum TaxID=6943 RepID=A0AAQ4DTL3_AMBAM
MKSELPVVARATVTSGYEKRAPRGGPGNCYFSSLCWPGQLLLQVMKSELPVVARATVTSGYEKRAPRGGPGNCYFRLRKASSPWWPWQLLLSL